MVMLRRLFQLSLTMKKLFTACLVACAALPALSQPSQSLSKPLTNTQNVLSGEVLEVTDAAGYTYLRLKTKDGETWAAVNQSPVKVGSVVTIGDPMVMQNFESKSLKKTFPTIVFGSLAGSSKPMLGPHSGGAPTADAAPIRVEKAQGTNPRTVAEVHTKAAELKDKAVQVRGKVVKFNPAIMDRNWIHLRDGSGSEANGTHDILVTTHANAKVGDVVTVSGTVRVDKDFGAGYAYKVLIEDAAIRP